MPRRARVLDGDFPVRITKVLDRLGITYLDELAQFSRRDLLRLRQFGKGSLALIEARLSQAHLSLSLTDYTRFPSPNRLAGQRSKGPDA